MKARASPRALAVIATLVAFSLSGCDSFSLPDLFVLPGDGLVDSGDDSDSDPDPEVLSLAVDRDTAERLTGTIALTPSGGTPPYNFTVTASDLYSGTNSESLGSASDDTYIYAAGGAIGTIRITVRDSVGGSVPAYVAVLPSKPVFNTASSKRLGSGDTVNLYWSYTDTAYEKYRLEFSTDSQTYTTLSGSAKGTTSYTDNNIIDADTYYYRLYTIAGSWESEPALISLARP